jgi:ribokinase
VANVIITLGKEGAYLFNEQVAQLIPSYTVEAVDTTAAGDTFNGALAVALSEGQEMVEAVKFANLAAAVSVTRLGAQSSLPLRQEVEPSKLPLLGE